MWHLQSGIHVIILIKIFEGIKFRYGSLDIFISFLIKIGIYFTDMHNIIQHLTLSFNFQGKSTSICD